MRGNKSNFMSLLMILAVFMVLSVTMGAIVAGSISQTNGTNQTGDQSQLYVSPDGNDNWDGQSPTPVNATCGPKRTITNATATVTSGGTVHIASGTYNEHNITINKDVTLIGANQDNTIIAGENEDRIFYCKSNNVKISNLTLKGGNNDNGGAIYNTGTLTVVDTTLTGNTASYGGGGAIYSRGNGCTVTGCTFTNNTATYSGGALYSKDKCTVTGCKFINNTAANYGGAIVNDGNDCTVNSCEFIGNTAGNTLGDNIYSRNGSCTITGCAFTNSIDSAIATDSGNFTVTGCEFTGNSGSDGGAIYSRGNGCTVTGCTFINNTGDDGGAISNSAPCTIRNCTFINNTAPNLGGGAIGNDGSCTIAGCTFINNTADEGGAISNSAPGTVTGCTFINNTANDDDVGGGAVFYVGDNGTSMVFRFNRVVGNNPNNSAICSQEGIVNAQYNWWGSNNDPSGYVSGGVKAGGVVNLDPWLVLTVTADSSSMSRGDNSTVTADLQHDSNGTYHNLNGGHVPDGIPVSFGATLGSLNPASATLTNGVAKTVFTAKSSGVANTTSTLDSGTSSVNITIDSSNTTTIVDNVKDTVGQRVNLMAHIRDVQGNPVSNGQVIFAVNNNTIGTVNVRDGTAILNYTPTEAGNYTVNASYIGTSDYKPSKGMGVLIVSGVQPGPTPPTPSPTPSPSAGNDSSDGISGIVHGLNVAMKGTGMPIIALVLAILAVLGGSFIAHRK